MDEKATSTPGSRLRALRRNRGLTLREVAATCGTSSTYIGLIENDRRKPGRDLLFRLATLFGVSPRMIETGEMDLADRATAARFELWPEITYLIANHIIVPRLLDAAKIIPDSNEMREAVRQAWDSRHFCEYREWATSPAGEGIGAGLCGKGLIESLIENAEPAGKWGLDHGDWIDLAAKRGLSVNRPMEHCSAVGEHAGGLACECYAFDIDTTSELASRMPIGYPGGARRYRRDLLHPAFVDRAFPFLFWSASRLWSERRIAGWLWYLDLAFDLYGPLVAVAKQCDAPEVFRDTSHRLLRDSTGVDQDLFLGLFVDVYRNDHLYQSRYGERVWLNEGGFLGTTQTCGFGLPLARRLKHRIARDRVRLELIYEEGVPEQIDRTSRFLDREATKAAPHEFTEGAWLVLKKREPFKLHPKLNESPPETLT